MSAAGRQVEELLWGTWRLVSYTRRLVVTGERTEPFGPAPRGFISYGRDGRMMVLIVKGGRPRREDVATLDEATRAELFSTMVAYAGTFSFDGKAVTHRVEVSFNEAWSGTEQVRLVRLEGPTLVLGAGPQPDPVDGRMMVAELRWERAAGREAG